MEDVNWTVGESTGGHLTFYVGLNRMVIDSDVTEINNMTVPTHIEWGSDSCTAAYCQDCEDAAESVTSSVVIAFITCTLF